MSTEFAKYAQSCAAPCSDPPPTACDANTITLTAKPANGWVFRRWTTAPTKIDASVTFSMAIPRTISAEFVQRTGMSAAGLMDDLRQTLVYFGISDSVETFDQNEIAYDDDAQQVFTGNGIPDAAEFLLLQRILERPAKDFAYKGGVGTDFVAEAWTHNVTRAATDLPSAPVYVQYTAAAYMTLGSFGSVERINAFVRGRFRSATLAKSNYNTSQSVYLLPKGDADTDAISNIEEWHHASDHNEYVSIAIGGQPSGGSGGASSQSPPSSQSDTCCALNCQDGVGLSVEIGYDDYYYYSYGNVEIRCNGESLAPNANHSIPRGSKVELKAIPASGCSFAGWDGGPIDGSTLKTEEFVAWEDTDISALFDTYYAQVYYRCHDGYNIECDEDVVYEGTDWDDVGYSCYNSYRGPWRATMTVFGPCIGWEIYYNVWWPDTYEAVTNSSTASVSFGPTPMGIAAIPPCQEQEPCVKPCDVTTIYLDSNSHGRVTGGGLILGDYTHLYQPPFVGSIAICDSSSAVFHLQTPKPATSQCPATYDLIPSCAGNCPGAVSVTNWHETPKYRVDTSAWLTGKTDQSAPCVGYVAKSPNQKYYCRDANGQVPTVELTANPLSGYAFVKWGGEGQTDQSIAVRDNTANPITVTVDSDLEIRAIFRLAQCCETGALPD